MRIEGYRRYFTEDGYMVMGSGKDWNTYSSSTCAPIKMSPICLPVSGEPYSCYDNLEELIQLADSDMFHPSPQLAQQYSEAEKDFRTNYAEIMRGNRPDWQLHAFRVFVGGIQLYYGNKEAHDDGFLWILEPKSLGLAFETSRTRLGFIPTYKVRIEHRGDSFWTEVEEDLGYIRREITFHPLHPYMRNVGVGDYAHQYIDVVEYAGM